MNNVGMVIIVHCTCEQVHQEYTICVKLQSLK